MNINARLQFSCLLQHSERRCSREYLNLLAEKSTGWDREDGSNEAEQGMCHAAQLFPDSLERTGKAETLSHPTSAMISQLNRCWAVEEHKLGWIYFFKKAQGLKFVFFSGCNSSFANALFLKKINLPCVPVTKQSRIQSVAAGRRLARLKPLSAPTGGPLFTLGPQQEEKSLSIL